MNTLPVIDLTATGKNITFLRKRAGISVSVKPDRMKNTAVEA